MSHFVVVSPAIPRRFININVNRRAITTNKSSIKILLRPSVQVASHRQKFCLRVDISGVGENS